MLLNISADSFLMPAKDFMPIAFSRLNEDMLFLISIFEIMFIVDMFLLTFIFSTFMDDLNAAMAWNVLMTDEYVDFTAAFMFFSILSKNLPSDANLTSTALLPLMAFDSILIPNDALPAI